MTRSFGPKQRTRADKQAAALQFAVLADRTDEEKVEVLMRSYGMREPDAVALVERAKGQGQGHV